MKKVVERGELKKICGRPAAKETYSLPYVKGISSAGIIKKLIKTYL